MGATCKVLGQSLRVLDTPSTLHGCASSLDPCKPGTRPVRSTVERHLTACSLRPNKQPEWLFLNITAEVKGD